MNRRKFLKLGGIGAAGALCASYPVFIERYTILVNSYEIPVPNLPNEFTSFKIVQLTDLHYGFLVPEIVISYVVRKANSLGADIIVCTGDYIHERNDTKEIETVWPILAELEAPSGVFSVLGNHDHWGDFERSMHWLVKTGQNIRHKSKFIERNGKKLWIGGAGDLWEDEIGIDTAFENVPQADCKIVLAHNPDTADEKFDSRINLMLCGHTHGGQVNIPFIGPPVLPVKNRRYSDGLIQTPKTPLFISKGIGWAVLPIRFNCYPEIAVLTLKKSATG